ncbi:hypothetical protein QBC37DRAFT_354890 [Rhypophila decipiens]|uniref:Uncharacterized protein n=1 Tax=Rhypophila decipiens TaxID=261697 RepID=A0AAN6XVX5_9PEZI|nr:hypothetical protein QBC37DRAFT_354890 [Rhypophila decipiens]
MKITSAVLLFAGLTTAAPTDEGKACPPPAHLKYHITNFSAAKGHMSGYCRYEFDVAGPRMATPKPAHCTAYVDAGFSGATWLALVWNGTCDNDAVKWTFSDPVDPSGDALFQVSINNITGNYTVPAKDITVWLNDEPNPFDNDVAYTGPKEFYITEF